MVHLGPGYPYNMVPAVGMLAAWPQTDSQQYSVRPGAQRKPEQRRLSIVDPATSTEIAVAEESPQLSPVGSHTGSLGSPQPASVPPQQPGRATSKQQRLHIVNPETGQAVQLDSQVGFLWLTMKFGSTTTIVAKQMFEENKKCHRAALHSSQVHGEP